MCIDTMVVNKKIIKYRFSIPHLDDMFAMLVVANILSKIDFHYSYHQIYIILSDE